MVCLEVCDFPKEMHLAIYVLIESWLQFMGTTTIFCKLQIKQVLSKDCKMRRMINSLPWELPGTKYQTSHLMKLSEKLSYMKICFTEYQLSDYLLDI